MKTATDPSPDATRSNATIRTTLYDLIEAINDEIGPDEEQLVVATVVHLLQTGRVRFLEYHNDVN